jgi:tetratricopeptide (TPR) repeat protein
MVMMFLLALMSPSVAGDIQARWTDAVSRIERSMIEGELEELTKGREALRAILLSPAPADWAPRLKYGVAYADYRLAILSPPTPASQAALQEAATFLEEATKADPRFAEAHALLATVYGLQIDRDGEKAMVLGPRTLARLTRAAALEPQNPRVRLHQSVGAFHTPAEYGGSKEKAEDLARKAVALFAQEPRDKPWPNWGRAEGHAWLGQVLASRGDVAGARKEYERALALEPKFDWVQKELLPKLGPPTKP